MRQHNTLLRDRELLLQWLNNQRGVPKIGSLSLIPETHNFDLQHVPWYLPTYTHHTKLGVCQALGPRSSAANAHTHHTLHTHHALHTPHAAHTTCSSSETQTVKTLVPPDGLSSIQTHITEEPAPEVPPVLIYTHAH